MKEHTLNVPKDAMDRYILGTCNHIGLANDAEIDPEDGDLVNLKCGELVIKVILQYEKNIQVPSILRPGEEDTFRVFRYHKIN